MLALLRWKTQAIEPISASSVKISISKTSGKVGIIMFDRKPISETRISLTIWSTNFGITNGQSAITRITTSASELVRTPMNHDNTSSSSLRKHSTSLLYKSSNNWSSNSFSKVATIIQSKIRAFQSTNKFSEASAHHLDASKLFQVICLKPFYPELCPILLASR